MRWVWIMLVAAPMWAQRIDGCTVSAAPLRMTSVNLPSPEQAGRLLEQNGIYPITREKLIAALAHPLPEIRSLAAMTLWGIGQAEDLQPLLDARLAEKDACAWAMINLAASNLAAKLLYDKTQHPHGELYVKPFQKCETEASVVTLTLKPVPGYRPYLDLVAHNETERLIPFIQSSPQVVFSATVLNPDGPNAKIAKQPEFLDGPGPGIFLKPGEERKLWTWHVDDDFDLSTPGTYKVSLGGRFPYLNTTVCSNVAEVTVQ
jgi:hypothetical protein